MWFLVDSFLLVSSQGMSGHKYNFQNMSFIIHHKDKDNIKKSIILKIGYFKKRVGSQKKSTKQDLIEI